MKTAEQKEFEQLFIGGWETEVTPELQGKNTVSDIQNMRIRSSGTGSANVEDINGNAFSFQITTGYKALLCISIQKLLVVVSCKHDDITRGEIGVVQNINERTGVGVYTMVYANDNFGFSQEKQLKGLGIIERENIIRAYFWDRLNPIRTFNVYDLLTNVSEVVASGDIVPGKKYMVLGEVPVTYDGNDYGALESTSVFTATATITYSGGDIVLYPGELELFTVSPKVYFNPIEFQQIIAGNVYAGLNYYFYKLCDKDGNGTPWSMPSLPVAILKDDYPTSLTQEDDGSYQEIQGGNNDDVTNKGVQLIIENIDQNYTHIQVAYVKATDKLDFAVPVVFLFEELLGATSYTVLHTANTAIDLFDTSELIGTALSIISNRDATAARNEFVVVNYETQPDVPYDMSASVTTASIKKVIPADMMTSANGGNWKDYADIDGGRPRDLFKAPYVGDNLIEGSADFVDRLWPGCEYVVQGTGTVELLNNSAAVTRTIAAGNTFVCAPTETSFQTATLSPTISPCIILNKYGAVKKVIPIKNDYVDFKGSIVNNWLGSLWADQKYCYAIVLISNRGLPQYAHFLTEYTAPSIATEPLMTVNAFEQYSTRSLGVRFSDLNFNKILEGLQIVYENKLLTFDDFPNYFSGWSIVRTERDATILAEGILVPVKANTNLSTPTVGYQQSSNVARMDYWDNKAGDMENAFCFYSPDLHFDQTNRQTIEGDKIRIEAYHKLVNDDNVPGLGEQHVEGDFYYSALYDVSPSLSGAHTAVGSELRLDPKHCAFVEQNNVHYFGAPLKKFELSSAIDGNAFPGYKSTAGVQKIDIGVNGLGAIVVRETLTGNTGTLGAEAPAGTYELTLTNKYKPFYTQGEIVNDGTNAFITASYSFVDGEDPDVLEGRNAGLMFLNTKDEYATYGSDGFGKAISNRTNHLKPYVSLRREKGTLYGGAGASARANLVYYFCGHYQAFDGDFINELNGNSGIIDNVDVFGGDTMVNLWDVTRALMPADNPDGTIGNGAYDGLNSNWYHICSIFPVQTTINTHYRQGRHVAKDLHYNMLNSTNPDGISVGTTSSPEQKEQLVYNMGYSSKYMFKYPIAALPREYRGARYLRKTVAASEKKTDGQSRDSWRAFSVNRTLDVEGFYGEIVAVLEGNSGVIYFQEDAVGYIPIDERVSVANSLGEPLLLSEKNTMDRYDTQRPFVGCQHTFAVQRLETGYIFWDGKRKSIFYLNVGRDIILKNISEEKNQRYNFKNNFYGLSGDAIINGNGVFATLNSKYEEVLFTFKGRRNYNNEALEDISIGIDISAGYMFSTKLTYAPGLWCRHHEFLFSMVQFYPTIGNNTIYTKNKSIVREGESLYVCILSYTSAVSAVLPSADPLHWVFFVSASAVFVEDKGPINTFVNLVADSAIEAVVNPDMEDLCFENMRALTGRSQEFFTTVDYSNTLQAVSETTKPSLYYKVDTIHEWSIPLDPKKRRFTDTYLRVRFNKVNSNGSILVPKNTKTSILALLTYFKNAY